MNTNIKKTAIKTAVITTALFASASIFANTASTTASGQISSSAEVQTPNKGLLSKLNQGVHNTADKVGTGIEKGVDKTREVSKNTWEGTKNASHAVGNGVQNTADKVGLGIETGVDNTKEFTKDKWQNTKDFASEKTEVVKEKTGAVKDKASEKTDKAKKVTQDKWQKTKEALTPQPKQAGLSSNTNVELNTPVGSVKAGLSTDGSVKTQ